ncbi:MAG: hypothetical protein RAP41_06290 [Candidatus Orphnella occulta]|nr:hypothetical protein [Candidatus Orphnella occulta]MDP8297772.1 hypothetical protein [Candidatus Orphnella occulta]
MKQVFFSVASVLLFILISSAIAFNPLTVPIKLKLIRDKSLSGQIVNTQIDKIQDKAKRSNKY